jgi:DNA-directed RNA polymerase specialized sigma24 family protein
MMALREKGWFLDLAHTSDEVLLLFAQRARSQHARDELTCRHWRRLQTGLARLSARLRLTSWELDDAHQQAFFWIQEAIRAFDPGQLFLPQGSGFQTFLHRIIQLRLLDFCRSLNRRRKRFRLAGEQVHWPNNSLSEKPLAFLGQGEELRLHLDKAVSLLDPQARALWNELRQGKRLRDLPQLLRVSYRTLKRRWRRLRDQLRRALRHVEERTHAPAGM